MEAFKEYQSNRKTSTIMLIVAVALLSISVGLVFAQTTTDPEPDSPAQSIVTVIAAISGISIAVIALARDIITSKALDGKINSETKQSLLHNMDSAEMLLTKILEKGETQREIADTLYNQLLPEESKKIVNAYAAKLDNISHSLNKETAAFKRLREL